MGSSDLAPLLRVPGGVPGDIGGVLDGVGLSANACLSPSMNPPCLRLAGVITCCCCCSWASIVRVPTRESSWMPVWRSLSTTILSRTLFLPENTMLSSFEGGAGGGGMSTCAVSPADAARGLDGAAGFASGAFGGGMSTCCGGVAAFVVVVVVVVTAGGVLIVGIPPSRNRRLQEASYMGSFAEEALLNAGISWLLLVEIPRVGAGVAFFSAGCCCCCCCAGGGGGTDGGGMSGTIAAAAETAAAV